jgi:tRNA-2-methylthio-N6-dimethylallyladenosine synthase
VPSTRGPQREKHPDRIREEIETIVAAGGREVTLLGQNVTAYNWEDRLDFANLLRAVAGVDGLERIRFLTGHPRDMHARLIDAIGEDPKICPWLHIPLQSGSDRVLKRMKRLYRRADYLHMVEAARRKIPDVTFSSDFIVGFSGETETDFALTLETMKLVGFDSVFAFKYSPRPGTPAARLPDNVPLAEKKRRLAELFALQQTIWSQIADAQIGRTWQGIVEEPARRPAGAWRLRTANNRKVLVEKTPGEIGSQLGVRITGYMNTTFFGEPIDNKRFPTDNSSPHTSLD